MKISFALKRIFSFFLIIVVVTIVTFFCFNRPVKTYASGTLALAVSASAALISYLASMGITTTMNNVESGNDLVSAVNGITDGYSNNGQTWSDFLMENGDIDWLSVLIGKENATKALCVSYKFLEWASGLPDWLVGRHDMNVNIPNTLFNGAGISSNQGNFPIDNYYSSRPSNVPASTISTNFVSSNKLILYYSNSCTSEIYYNSAHTALYFTSWNPTHDRAILSGSLNTSNVLSVNLSYDLASSRLVIQSFTSSNVSHSFLYPTGYGINVSVSGISVEGSLSDGYQDLQDALDQELQEHANDADAVGTIDLGEAVQGVTVEQVLQDLVNRIIANNFDVADSGVLVYENVGVAEEEEKKKVAPTDQAVNNNIVVVDGLEDFFPFCIPWDFYQVIELLNVEPEAPKFTYKIDLSDTSLNMDYETELDLAPFETVAIVFRALIIVSFLIFLIIKTRDLIRG